MYIASKIRLEARHAAGVAAAFTVAALALTGCSEGSAGASGNGSGNAHTATTSGKSGDKVALAPLAKPLVTPGEVNTPQPESASQPDGENQGVPDSSGLQGNIPGVPHPSAAEIITFFLTDIRAAEHENFDRVVFEFSGANEIKGGPIGYYDEPVQQGTADILPVKGSAYLHVNIPGRLGVQTAEGPQFIKVGSLGLNAGLVTDVFYAGGTDDDNIFIIGANTSHEFNSFRLQDPPRLVIDFIK